MSERICEYKECKLSLNTTLSIGDNQVCLYLTFVIFFHKYFQTQRRWIAWKLQNWWKKL